MRYYSNEEDKVEKIPYDKEPIIRQSNYTNRSNKRSSFGGGSKSLSFIICFLIIINIVLGVLVVKSVNTSKKNYNNVEVNITSNSYLDVSAVASKAKRSVVCVNAGITSASTPNPDYQGFFSLSSKGSGVIFQDDKDNGVAYIVTCFHVIRNHTTQIYVLLYDNLNPIKATMVGYSSYYDIAVIKIQTEEYKTSKSKSAEIADSAMVLEGDGAVVIGNPMGKGFSVTSGVISKTVDLISVDGITRRCIRTEAAINGGNSGGGMFDNKGRLIGIVQAKAIDNASTGSYIDNIAYAIPSNVAESLAYNIQRNTDPLKAEIGMRLWVENSGIKYNLIDGKYIPVQTVIVESVSEGSSASNAVNERSQYAPIMKGDQIVAFEYNGRFVDVINTYSFDDHTFAINKGDKVIFHIIRSGVKITRTVVIDNVVIADDQDWYAQ